LTATGQDFFPRVSAAGNEPGVLKSLAQQQLHLLLLLGIPLLLGIKWGVSWALPYVLSGEFSRIEDILDWHLPGELFRFSSVSLGYVMLARASGVAVFVPALVNGAVMLIATYALVPGMDIAGLGFAFTISQLVYLVIVVVQVRGRFGFGLGGDAYLITAGLAGLMLPNFLPRDPAYLRFTVQLLFAGCATLYSAYHLRREWAAFR